MTLVHVLDEHHVPGKPLGRHVHHDPRSRDFPAVELVTPGVPVTSKLWRFPGKPLNQGQLGSCTGNATAHLLRIRRGRAVGLTEATARGIYSLATQIDPIPGSWKPRDPQAQDTGSDGLDALKAAQQLGLFAGAYRWCFGLSDVLRVLSQHGPVIIGIPWFEGFDQPASARRHRTPRPPRLRRRRLRRAPRHLPRARRPRTRPAPLPDAATRRHRPTARRPHRRARGGRRARHPSPRPGARMTDLLESLWLLLADFLIPATSVRLTLLPTWTEPPVSW